MTVSPHQERVAAAERISAVAEALASVRAEGLQIGPEDQLLFDALAVGDLSSDELRDRVLARYVP